MEGAQAATRTIASGAITFDGHGSYSATEDDSTPTGLAPNQSSPNASYSFSATAVPSRRGALDSSGQTVAHILSPTKLIYLETAAAKPRVVVLEK